VKHFTTTRVVRALQTEYKDGQYWEAIVRVGGKNHAVELKYPFTKAEILGKRIEVDCDDGFVSFVGGAW
jgi:hypothetical protein